MKKRTLKKAINLMACKLVGRCSVCHDMTGGDSCNDKNPDCPGKKRITKHFIEKAEKL